MEFCAWWSQQGLQFCCVKVRASKEEGKGGRRKCLQSKCHNSEENLFTHKQHPLLACISIFDWQSSITAAKQLISLGWRTFGWIKDTLTTQRLIFECLQWPQHFEVPHLLDSMPWVFAASKHRHVMKTHDLIWYETHVWSPNNWSLAACHTNFYNRSCEPEMILELNSVNRHILQYL